MGSFWEGVGEEVAAVLLRRFGPSLVDFEC